MKKITAVIPVKNGAATLPRCLDALHAQINVELEILILDSASSDNSVMIARRYGAKVINVLPGTFNHGSTRNEAAQHATGDLLFYSVQDAWLAKNDVLKGMADHFDDQLVMGVTGHQAIPWGEKDKNPVYWFKPKTEPVVEQRYFPTQGGFDALRAEEKFNLSNWDDVIAMYRKSALLETPFRNVSFCEDWIWANDALSNGYKIVRDPGLVIYHYHHLLFKYTFKTNYIIAYYFYTYFKHLKKIPWSPLNFLKAIIRIFKRHEFSYSEKLMWVWHNLKLNFAIFSCIFVFRLLFFVGGEKKVKKFFQTISNSIPQGQIKDGVVL